MPNLKLTRRDLIRAALAAPFRANVPGAKPNLLFIWTDQQKRDTLKVYGNAKIHAPNLNKLADQSIVFENAYVSQPVCTPSRSSIMTGLWPHQNTCVRNNVPLPENVSCLPEILNDAEYRTGYFGKWHLGDEVFPQHGFKEWESTEDGYRRRYGPHREKDRMSSYWHFLKDLGYQMDRDGVFTRGFSARLPIEHGKPKFLEQKACEFLRRHERVPFILYVNFLAPHEPFFGPLNDEHNPDEIDLPTNFRQPPQEEEPLRYRCIREEQRFRRGFKTEAEWRRQIANYWGLISQVDRSVGAILKTLDDLKLAAKTIVVFTSDHGEMMGSHQLEAKTVMYEEAVKVPLLLRIPQRRSSLLRGRFSHIDLVPTLLELLGAAKPNNLPGKSLVPVIMGKESPNNQVLIEWNPEEDPRECPALSASAQELERAHGSFTRTIIKEDWKACISNGDKSQLFNLRDDPGELHNLFYQKSSRQKINELRKGLRAWQKEVKDAADI